MFKKKISFLRFILLFLISGCAKKNVLLCDKNSKIKQQEARFFDVPLPLGYKSLENIYGPDSFVFKTSNTISELVDFYKEEMSYLGWKCLKIFNDNEVNLLFEKPHKFILISIRPLLKTKNSQIHIFVSIKNDQSLIN